MEKRVIDLDAARAKLFEIAEASNKEEDMKNVKLALDAAHLLETIWKRQNNIEV